MAFILLALALLVISLKHVVDLHYRIAAVLTVVAIIMYIAGILGHFRWA